jgi:hypothetical protein
MVEIHLNVCSGSHNLQLPQHLHVPGSHGQLRLRSQRLALGLQTVLFTSPPVLLISLQKDRRSCRLL